MFGLVKKLFGLQAPPVISADPFGREAAKKAKVGMAPSRPAPAVPPVVLQRDEILDGRTRLAGYRFAVHVPAGFGAPDAASTAELLKAHNLAGFGQRRLALIPVAAEDWLAGDYRPLIAANTVFLLAAPAENSQEAWSEALAQIRQSGAKVAVPVGCLGQPRLEIAGRADYILVDFTGYSLGNFEQLLGNIRRLAPNVQFMVENVSRWAEFRYCLDQGAAYCLGPFTTAPDEAQQRQEIGQSRLVLIEMLNQLRREAELPDIAEVAKRDPGVVVKIVAMANSPMVGLSQPVTSVDQAIMVLGREQLYRWLAIGMFRAGDASPRDEVLLELALARGRLLEVLGQERHGKLECDELFLLGLLSLLDSLLGVPMATVVERINLSPVLREVLLASGGPLGPYLMLAIAVEKGHVAGVERFARQLGYSLEAIDAASVEAIAWAEEAIRLTS